MPARGDEVHDPGVLKPLQRLDLGGEPRRVRGRVIPEQLDCDVRAGGAFRQPHLRHRPLSERAHERPLRHPRPAFRVQAPPPRARNVACHMLGKRA